MIETIFFTLIISLFLAIIGYIIYSITNNKYSKDNNYIDIVLKECDHKLNNLINPKLQHPKIPEPEIINPKLTQAIKEANEERESIQAQREKELYEKVLKERDRLLENDYIYKLIKEAVVNNRSSVEIKSDNITITEKAVKSIPGLYLSPKIIGCFNYGCGNAEREEPSSVLVYFQRRVNPMCL